MRVTWPLGSNACARATATPGCSGPHAGPWKPARPTTSTPSPPRQPGPGWRTARFSGPSHLPGDDHPSAHDAALIVSELVSNAITHSRSGQPGGTVLVAIEAAAQPAEVRIEVRDAGGPRAPVLTAADPGSEHGRGLAIISALAAEWASETSQAGRATWCRLSTGRGGNVTAARVPDREAG